MEVKQIYIRKAATGRRKAKPRAGRTRQALVARPDHPTWLDSLARWLAITAAVGCAVLARIGGR